MRELDGCHNGYLLHPSLMSGALQAGMRLIADQAQHPGMPLLPLALERLHILSPCTEEMFAWARQAQGLPEDAQIKLDIDLIDSKGNVCVQMRRLSFQAGNAAIEPAVTWLFSTKPPSTNGSGTAYTDSMGLTEKMELFLKQEIALQMQKPIEEIPTDQSYFDQGLTPLRMTQLMQKLNRLLDENLSPSALFDYTDIRSLAGYLAITYPAKIGGIVVVRQKDGQAHSEDQLQIHPATLVPMYRKKHFSGTLAAPSQAQASTRAPRADMSDEQILEKILWREASLDSSYEKVAF